MRVFTVNVGNTHCRMVAWRDGTIAWQRTLATDVRPKLPKLPPDSHVVIAGVVPEVKTRIAALLRKSHQIVHVFRNGLEARLTIIPKPAARVGDDRIASALGALALDPTRPWVIVDAGTAMTINAITPGKNGRLPRFEGGLIVPGSAMSLKALAHFTAQLPDLSTKECPSKKTFIGRNTEEAILLGVYQANIATAVELAKGQLRELGSDARIVLTGGGAGPDFGRAFKKACPSGIVSIHPNLVDLGLFSCWKEASHT